jgi:uncharacterized protein YndB with AHSA1/START domain
MKKTFTAQASITVRAETGKVWDALVNPNIIKQYLFGTETSSEWKVGSSITYKGVWEGKPYEDKGMLLELVPNKLLKSTYWSSLSGLPDIPENYHTVTYALSKADGGTELSVTQENIQTREAAEHSEGNWTSVLQAIKKILEKEQ